MPNQIQALAMLPKLSEQQLLMALQANDGTLPSYAVMAELQARKKRAMGVGGGMPVSTVKDDMTRGAGGLQSLGMPPQTQAGERQFASGGKIEDDLREYGFDPLWPKIRDYFMDPNRAPIGEALFGAPAWQSPAPPAAVPQQPFSDARMSAGYGPGTLAPTDSPRGREQAKAAATKPDGGIRSLKASASMSGKVSPGGPAPAGFDFQPITLRTINDAMKDVPMDGALAEQIAAYKDQAGDTAQRKQNAKYEALMRAGLTMARTPGGLMNSIAAGGLEGLNAYGTGMKEASAMERERMKELSMLQQAQSAQALQRYGIANATRFGEAGIADKNQDNRFNAYKTGVESADRRYAADAGVRAAAMRAEAGGTGAEKYRMDMLKQLRGAVEKARESIAKKPEGMMAGMSPVAKMKYEQAVDEEVLRTLSTMTLEYPEIMMLYRQMRGGEGLGSPSIIRGGALPPGAQVRE